MAVVCGGGVFVVVFLCLCFCGGGGGVFEVFLCFCDGVFVCFFCLRVDFRRITEKLCKEC